MTPWRRLADRRGDGPDAVLLLWAWSCVALGIGLNNGLYASAALALVVAGTALAFAACVAGPLRWSGAPRAVVALTPPALLAVYAAVEVGPTHFRYLGFYDASRVSGAVACVAVLAALRDRRAFWPALALLALTCVLRVVATPTPPIDVHFLLTDSTRGLVQGRNMYQQSWPGSHGLQNEYPYLPWTSVLLLPTWLLTHEVRIGLVVALVCAAVVLRRLAKGATPAVAGFLPLLLICYPLYPYQLQQSWTEPLLLACLAGCVLAVGAGRTGWGVVLLALALASKQHVALLLPMAALWPAFGWRRTIGAAGLGFALVAPWLLADPHAFWHDAVDLNLGYPVETRALDVPALFLRHGHLLGFGVTAVVALAAYGVALFRLPRTTAGFAAGSGLVELALDTFNKQSFYNHYTLPMGLFVIALVAGWREHPPSAGPRHGGKDEQGLVLEDSAV